MHGNAQFRYCNDEVLHGILNIEYFVDTNIINYIPLHMEHNHKGGDFEQKQLINIFPTTEVQNIHANFLNVCCCKYSNV